VAAAAAGEEGVVVVVDAVAVPHEAAERVQVEDREVVADRAAEVVRAQAVMHREAADRGMLLPVLRRCLAHPIGQVRLLAPAPVAAAIGKTSAICRLPVAAEIVPALAISPIGQARVRAPALGLELVRARALAPAGSPEIDLAADGRRVATCRTFLICRMPAAATSVAAEYRTVSATRPLDSAVHLQVARLPSS
jgi:hypothetical protein